MTGPTRLSPGSGIYFVTACTFQRRCLFQSERFSLPFMETLLQYRLQRKYLLHEFVVMPDHVHLLITPTYTLERAMQLIKGGFAARAGRERKLAGEIWHPTHAERRITGVEEYIDYRSYMRRNPVMRGLAETAEEYPYSSAYPGFVMDEVPDGLRLTA